MFFLFSKLLEITETEAVDGVLVRSLAEQNQENIVTSGIIFCKTEYNADH